jgi:hypothetical protein
LTFEAACVIILRGVILVVRYLSLEAEAFLWP